MAKNESFLTRLKSWIFGDEGSWRGPFSGVGELGGFYPLTSIEDGWQRNLQIPTTQKYIPTVYGCVMVISRAISQCYPQHVLNDNGNITYKTNTAAFRTLNKPNSYQTTPGFLLNLIASALFDGESFAIAARNDRNEVVALHQMPRGLVQVRITDDGDIFYAVGQNPLVSTEIDYIVPARDMLHLRFYTPRNPLIGETPLKAAALAIGINVALNVSQAAFFSQMNRPSGVLATDQQLNKEQMNRLREAFNSQSKLLSQGGIPILSNGLKFSPMSVSNDDAQLIEAQRMSTEEICRVYGVPPPMIGDLTHATLNNSETLIQYFMSISLGSYLEQVERTFDSIFNMPNNEYVQLDTSALLRTDFVNRIEGLAKAVQGGIMSPNEARALEGLGPIDGGNSAYLQKQMVPIDRIGKLLDAETEAKLNPPQPTAPAAPPANETPPPDTPAPSDQGNKEFTEKQIADAEENVVPLVFYELEQMRLAA